MSLDTLVNVSVALSGPTPSQASFGAALIAAYHSVGGAARVLGPYASTADMVSAGFGSASPAVLAATKYFSQTPKPTAVYVGRRANVFTQKVSITPLSHTTGDFYAIKVGATAGVGGTLVSHTNASESLAAICTLLATAITAVGLGTADGSSGTHVDWTATTAGVLTEFQNQTLGTLGLKTTTVDPGISADLDAIYGANQKDWYGLVLDSNSAAEISAAATWVEAKGKIFPANSADTEIANAGSTTDLAYTLMQSAYARTGVMLVANSNMSYAGAAWLGKMLPTTPGKATWMYNTLAGVTVDALPPGWDAAVLAKKASVYTALASVNTTQGATTSSGEYFDITHFIDWLQATIQISVLALFLNNPKIAFDDLGIEIILNTIRGVLALGVENDGLVDGTTSVTAPSAANVSSVDRGNRNLPGVAFAGRLAGAIHKLTIAGVVTQ